MKTKTIVSIAFIVIVVGGLFYWGRQSEPSVVATWGDTDIACLINGHTNLAFHYHPFLSITVDGVPEPIPANVGITNECMAEVHTHDGSGELHIESFRRDKVITLQDFFTVWGRDIEREGYNLVMTVDGEVEESLGSFVPADGEQIVLVYTLQVLDE